MTVIDPLTIFELFTTNFIKPKVITLLWHVGLTGLFRVVDIHNTTEMMFLPLMPTPADARTVGSTVPRFPLIHDFFTLTEVFKRKGIHAGICVSSPLSTLSFPHAPKL